MHELAQALESLGLEVEFSAVAIDQGVDAILIFEGRQVPVEIKLRATVTPQQAVALSASRPHSGVARIVVADRVVEAARGPLRDAGWSWLDRRGHIHLTAPGILIDAVVPRTGRADAKTDPLAGQVAKEVASWILANPHDRIQVRALARRLERAASSVSGALVGLREAGLLSRSNAPVVPELFWELSSRWATTRIPLASEPYPGDLQLTRRLQLGLEQVTESAGWALSDTLAAAAYGAPIAARSDSPPDFLVPSKQVERLAVMFLGSAPHQDRRCTIRVSPVRWACQRRVDESHGSGTHWPLAHPLIVALDLASDPDRGRQILDVWDPPGPWTRVW